MEKKIKCPKCGTMNESTNKFCGECGAKLQDLKISCPKCGKPNVSTNKFCTSCGTSLIVIPEKHNKHVPTSSIDKVSADKTSTDKVFKIVAVCLFGLGVLLAFVGVFGDVFQNTSTSGVISVSKSFSINWFFKDCWDALSTLKGSAVYGLDLFGAIVHLLTWLLALSIIIIVFIKSLINIIKSPLGNTESLSKNAKLLISCSVPYIAFTSMFLFSSSSTSGVSTSTEWGWGTMLLFVSLVIIIVSSLFLDLNQYKKMNIVSLALKKFSVLLVAIVAFACFTSSISISSGVGAEKTVTSGTIFSLFESALSSKFTLSANNIANFSVSLIFFILSIVFISLSCAKNKPVLNITFRIILFAGLLSGSLMLLFTYKNFVYSSSLFLSVPMIVGIVLSTVSLGLEIAASTIDKKYNN